MAGPRSAGVWLFLLGVLLGLAAFRRTRQRGALLVGTHDTPIGTEVLGGAANAPGDREPQ